MGDEECRIQINNGGDWIEKAEGERQQLIDSRLMEKKQWEDESIYRVPWSVRKLRSAAYQPQRVSIGPYHHGENSLKPMEKHKRRAFLNFLDRKNKRLQCYVDALEPKVEELMGAYDQLQPHWKENTKAFLELMIVDGCFILELMATSTVIATQPKPALKEMMGYDTIDPVFSHHGHLYVVPFLRRDMLMLENQIPLQVLSNILLVADGGRDLESKENELIKEILGFLDRSLKTKDADVRECGNCFPGRPKSKGSDDDDDPKFKECFHILGVYRKSRLLPPSKKESTSRLLPPSKKESTSRLPNCCGFRKEHEPYIRSATELVEAGIGFKKSKTTKLNDVSFERGVLKLPEIVVDGIVETEFLNMMALERLHKAAGSEVTSYVIFMDKMIDTAKDVSLLHWNHILWNYMGSDDAVATLFNSLSREACLDSENYLVQVQKEVNKSYRSPPRRCLAIAKHTYFTNPWVSLSVVAAIFLFALTIVQTLYAVLDYHRPDKPP